MTSKPNRKEAVLAMLFALMVLSAAVASIAAPPITKAQTPGVWMAPPYVVTRQAVLPDSEGTSNPNFGGFCEGLGRQWVFFVGGGYGNSPGSWESSANDGQNWTSAQLTPFATANFFRVTCYGSTVYLVTNWEYGSADLYSGTLEDNGSISWSPTMNTAPSGPVGVSDYVSSIAFSASGYGLMLASGSAVYTYISGSSWNRILDVAGETGTCPTYSGILGATWLDNGEIAVIGECSVGGGLYLIGQTWVGTSWSSVKTITWAASSGDLVEAYLTHTGNTTDVWTNVGNTFDFFTYADSVGFTQTLSDSSSCSVYFCASYIASNDQGTLLAPYMTGSGFDYCASTDNGTTWSCGNLLAVNNDDGSGLCGAGEGCGEAIFSGDAYPVFWGQQGENVDVAEILDTHTAHIFLRFGPGMLSGDAVVNGTLHQLPWNYASQIGDLTTAVAPANVGTYDFLDWSNGTQYPSRTVEMETGVFNTTVFVANYRGVNYGNLVEGDWSGWSLALATNIPYSFPYRTYPIMGVDSLGTAYFGASTNVVENDPTTYVVFLNGTTDLINNTTPATLGQPYSAYGTYEVVPQTEGTTGYFLVYRDGSLLQNVTVSSTAQPIVAVAMSPTGQYIAVLLPYVAGYDDLYVYQANGSPPVLSCGSGQTVVGVGIDGVICATAPTGGGPSTCDPFLGYVCTSSETSTSTVQSVKGTATCGPNQCLPPDVTIAGIPVLDLVFGIAIILLVLVAAYVYGRTKKKGRGGLSLAESSSRIL